MIVTKRKKKSKFGDPPEPRNYRRVDCGHGWILRKLTYSSAWQLENARLKRSLHPVAIDGFSFAVAVYSPRPSLPDRVYRIVRAIIAEYYNGRQNP